MKRRWCRRQKAGVRRRELGRSHVVGVSPIHPSIHLLDLLYPRLGWWTCPLDVKHRPTLHCGICVHGKLVKYSQDGCKYVGFTCFRASSRACEPSVNLPLTGRGRAVGQSGGEEDREENDLGAKKF